MSVLPVVDITVQKRVQSQLIDWYRRSRRDLPWHGGSAYAVWISEIMLQQTQVATVIPYFERFMARFPTVDSLAQAPIEEVLRFWAGLGYYARARNLHRAAGEIVARFQGELPQTPAEIESLPGIGRYTSGAILSIAFDVPRPLVDANVVRVLCRVFGLRGDPKSPANQAALWWLAEQLVPASSPGDFNQGLMELGAMVCTPADPKCEGCPLLPDCIAGNSADPSALPETAPGRTPVAVSHSAAIIADDSGERFLIVQRPLHGLWGGLWEFPRVVCAPGEPPALAAVRAALEIVGLEVETAGLIGTVRHGVTHHRITLRGFAAHRKAGNEPRARECTAIRWESLAGMEAYAFSSPQVELRDRLQVFQGRSIGGEAQASLSL